MHVPYPSCAASCAVMRIRRRTPVDPCTRRQEAVSSIGGGVPVLGEPGNDEGEPMRALTWHGIEDVRISEVPDPHIEEPTDAVVRVTSTAICGSDLHLY